MDPFANRLANGEACPTCRERILDAAPAPLPRSVEEVEALGESESPWGRGVEIEPGSEASVWGTSPSDFDDPIGA